MNSCKDVPVGRLNKLQNKVTQCKKCPRLVKYLSSIRKKYPSYWCKPVPSFGDPNAQILIVGLAPGRFGSNRTGRMFTGDASGEFLYKTLHEVGLCNKPVGADFPAKGGSAAGGKPAQVHANDGLKLKNCYITAVGRCAPPQNKPIPKELANCFPYFEEEIKLLKNVRVVIALGRIAFDGYLKWLFKSVGATFTVAPNNRADARPALTKRDFVFFHSATYKSRFLPHILIASYHPSRQNTQTGRLTKSIFLGVFKKAIQYCSVCNS